MKLKKLLRLLPVILALTALSRLPFRGTDVARLIPVKTVIVTRSGEEYVVDVGAGVKGVGKTLSAALGDLRACVSGTVFFPTAEQVIAAGPGADDPETAAAIAEEPAFRPAAGFYLSPKSDLDPEAVGKYLSSHGADTTVMQVRADLRAGKRPRIPLLLERDGGYRIAEAEPR